MRNVILKFITVRHLPAGTHSNTYEPVFSFPPSLLACIIILHYLQDRAPYTHNGASPTLNWKFLGFSLIPIHLPESHQPCWKVIPTFRPYMEKPSDEKVTPLRELWIINASFIGMPRANRFTLPRIKVRFILVILWLGLHLLSNWRRKFSKSCKLPALVMRMRSSLP